MLGELENLAVIGALALENRAGVMQSVRQHVDFGVAPGNQSAVHPDEPVAIVKRNKVGHPGVILLGLYRWRF